MTECRTSHHGGAGGSLLIVLPLLVAFSGVSLGCLHRNSNAMLTVHYFPIDAETLTPVTAENILRRGGECVVSNPEDARRLTALIASAKPSDEPFLAKLVRVRVDSETGGGARTLVAVVDKGGNVDRAALGRGRLSPQEFASLKALVESCFASERGRSGP